MSEITLVALDLDGTLLDSRNRIRRDAKEALLRLQEEGVFLTLITGRSYDSTEPFVKELNLYTPFGLVHGAFVRDLQGLELVKRVIPEAGVREAVDFAFEYELVPLFIDSQVHGRLTVCEEQREHPIVGYVISSNGGDDELRGTAPNFVAREDLRLKAFAAYLIGRSRSISSLLEMLSRQQVNLFDAERFPVRAAGAPSEFVKDYEVAMLSPIGADKGTALEAVAETLGVSLENVLAFGDWHNDIPMLQKAGHAVLMGNAPPELIGQLQHPHLMRTGTNDSTGIVDGLVRFGLF